MNPSLIHQFRSPITSIRLPDKFTYPFHYDPHPLCIVAVEELQDYLSTETKWRDYFSSEDDENSQTGKMFGILIVKNQFDELCYLRAFSGKLDDQNHHTGFVPPVFDMLEEGGFFKRDLAKITDYGHRISDLRSNPQIELLRAERDQIHNQAELAIKHYRAEMIEAKKRRKQQRVSAKSYLTPLAYEQLKYKLAQQSIDYKNKLKALTQEWQDKLEQIDRPLAQLTSAISELKVRRKEASCLLQNKLFEQYQFLNQQGESKNLITLFEDTAQRIPPAGAGECAAPKLLQYAFQNGLRPVAMAEFWWGVSPQSEVRKHKQFYPACQGKCQPILTHMLDGIAMDTNPLLNNPAVDKSIEIIYQDDVMVIINKPSGLLSVPGKSIDDSVYSRMKLAFPHANSPLIVHRLDMSTSGLMVIALTKQAHQFLQKQFINRTVDKRYVADLDGILLADKGTISLPLRVDLDDRPRQLVCYDYGRHAETDWKIISRTATSTRVYFYPKTGRTHQLRVHAAHTLGLNTAIVGDDLYGNKADRLHLHAESLTLIHPIDRTQHTYQINPSF